MAVDISYTAAMGGAVYAGRLAPGAAAVASFVGALGSVEGAITVAPGPAVATTATLALSSTAGTTGVATSGTVTLNGVAPSAGSVTLVGAGATFAPASLSWSSGESGAAKSFTITRAADGSTNPVAITNTMALSNLGATSYTSTAPVAGGTFRQIGTQTYKQFMDGVRAAMPEGAASANARMHDAADQLAFCGAVIWRNQISLGISGGHSAGYDDAHIAQDVLTGAWTVHYPSSDTTFDFAPLNSFGEQAAAPNRPASAHSYFHQCAQGDNIFNGVNAAILGWASRSGQSHRWNGSLRGGLGQWERYGDQSVSQLSIYHVYHDAPRNRFVRYPMEFLGTNVFQWIHDNNPAATWTTIVPSNWPVIGPFASPGYHEALDCIVVVDLHNDGSDPNDNAESDTGRVGVFVADPTNLAAGWTRVTCTGTLPPDITTGGLEYVPPMHAFALTNQSEPSKLYYLRPNSTNKYGSWAWSSETFTGPGGSAGSGWLAPGSAPMDSYSRLRWSEAAQGLVALKSTQSLTEILTPAEVADWITRSTAPGVVAAYDFSDPPANGGTWKFGSTQASPKTTVWAMGSFDAVRVRDTVVAPPGSKASLRFDIPGNSGERADAWRISIDNYADQFGEGAEFWVQWRCRMNSVAATENFLASDGSGTDYKQLMISAGMQTPNVIDGTPRGSYGYPGSESDNTLADARIDSQGEIVLKVTRVASNASVPAPFRKMEVYVSKFFDGTGTRGQDINYGTLQNAHGTIEDGDTGFNEGAHVAACQWTNPGTGDQYTDWTTCFALPVDEWFTQMIHIKLGTLGTASSMGGPTRTGYTNSEMTLYAALNHGKMRMLHHRSGIVFPVDQTVPQGSEGPQKYGQFGFTTFMTSKSAAQAHGLAQIWYGQIVVKSGATPPATPI